MSRILIPALLAPLPALAHEGAHLHPHGAESPVAAMTVLALAAVAVGAMVWWRR
jgi:hypothetical protein